MEENKPAQNVPENKDANFIISGQDLMDLSQVTHANIDNKTVDEIDAIEKYKQLMNEYFMKYRLQTKKNKQMQRDPLLVIKQKKSKRRLRNKNRKINQTKARQSRYSK